MSQIGQALQGVSLAAVVGVGVGAAFGAWLRWALSLLLGLVLGGSQSVSRAMMALMTPPHRTAEFFGFFNFSGRATSWIGTFLFGLVMARTGSARLAILSLLVLFVMGWAITARVDVAQGQREALN